MTKVRYQRISEAVCLLLKGVGQFRPKEIEREIYNPSQFLAVSLPERTRKGIWMKL